MWIADYDAHGKEFPTCVHVTRTAQNGVISGATYVPIWDGKEARNERDALERRIDELCAEVERLHAEQVYWELGNCPNCPNIVSLQEALENNDNLRKLVLNMWLDLDVPKLDSEEYKRRMCELGIEVPE